MASIHVDIAAPEQKHNRANLKTNFDKLIKLCDNQETKWFTDYQLNDSCRKMHLFI